MLKNMNLSDWIGKTIKDVEVKNISFMNSNDAYFIHFTDGTQAKISASIVSARYSHLDDTVAIRIDYEDNREQKE